MPTAIEIYQRQLDLAKAAVSEQSAETAAVMDELYEFFKDFPTYLRLFSDDVLPKGTDRSDHDLGKFIIKTLTGELECRIWQTPHCEWAIGVYDENYSHVKSAPSLENAFSEFCDQFTIIE